MSRSLVNLSLNSSFLTLAFNSLANSIAKFITNSSIFVSLENSLNTSSTSIKRFINEIFVITNEDKKKKKEEREKKRKDEKIKNKKKEENKNTRFY